MLKNDMVANIFIFLFIISYTFLQSLQEEENLLLYILFLIGSDFNINL
jgi:uncharacterized membrane protein